MQNNELLFIPARKSQEQLITKRPNVRFTYQTSPIHKENVSQQQKITKRTSHRKKFFIKSNQHRLSFKSNQDKFSSIRQKEIKKNNKRLKIFNEPKYIKTQQHEEIFSDEETIVNKLQKLQAITNQLNPITKKLNKPKPSGKKVKVRFSYDDGFYKKSQKIIPDNKTPFISDQNSPKQTSLYQEVLTKQNKYPPTYVDDINHYEDIHNFKLQSSVVNYRYSPKKLSIAVGGSNFNQNKNKQSKVFKISKYSEKNDTPSLLDINKTSGLKINENLLRKSFQPVLEKTAELNDKTNQLDIFSQQQQKQKGNRRFFDIDMSPTLLSRKKISYQQIDPLSSSLRKKKTQRQTNLKRSQSQPTSNIIEVFMKKLSSLRINEFNFSEGINIRKEKINNLKNYVLNGLKSQGFVSFVLILLSLIILFAQLIS